MPKTGSTLTRRDFLRVTGTGAAGMALLGAPLLGSGCGRWSEMNVVLVIIDSLRRDHIGAYGNGWIQTPNLDSLAGESLRFTRPYPESEATICVRRAIHTGMRTFPFKDRPALQKETSAYGWLSIPDWQPTLAETLKKQGYRTALVTDTYHQFSEVNSWANFGRGFDIFRKIRGQERDAYRDASSVSKEEMQRYLVINEDMKYKTRQYLANTADRRSEEDWFAPQVFLNATEALEEVRRREPFFLVIDSFDPHEPWDPPEKYASLYGSPEDHEGQEPLYPEARDDSYLADWQLKQMRAGYSGEITMVDRWLGNFLEKAHELGVMENTLLVLISDHGHALGEHDLTGKPPWALYPELTDIVFFIRHPEGKGAGETSDYFASTHDVAPTILGFLGIEPRKPMDGQDLSVLFDGAEPEPRPHFTLGFREFVWSRDDRHVMFGPNDGSWAKLFDVREDPEMDNDLAYGAPEVVQRMFEEYVLRDAGGGPLPTY